MKQRDRREDEGQFYPGGKVIPVTPQRGGGSLVAHAETHATDGSDPVSPESIGALGEDDTAVAAEKIEANNKRLDVDGKKYAYGANPAEWQSGWSWADGQEPVYVRPSDGHRVSLMQYSPTTDPTDATRFYYACIAVDFDASPTESYSHNSASFPKTAYDTIVDWYSDDEAGRNVSSRRVKAQAWYQTGACYEKPATGIPGTDLAAAVQTSLGKADTALQSTSDLNGDKITSGTVAAERIANLGASKITSGTFAAERLPSATTSTKGAVKIETTLANDAKVPTGAAVTAGIGVAISGVANVKRDKTDNICHETNAYGLWVATGVPAGYSFVNHPQPVVNDVSVRPYVWSWTDDSNGEWYGTSMSIYAVEERFVNMNDETKSFSASRTQAPSTAGRNFVTEDFVAPSAHLTDAAAHSSLFSSKANAVHTHVKSDVTDFPTAMTPTPHMSTHIAGGSDAILPMDIGALSISHNSDSTAHSSLFADKAALVHSHVAANVTDFASSVDARLPYATAPATAALADRTCNAVTVTSSAVTLTFPAAVSGKMRDFLVYVDASGFATGGALTITLPSGATHFGDDFPAVTAAGEHLIAVTEIAANKFFVKAIELEEVA